MFAALTPLSDRACRMRRRACQQIKIEGTTLRAASCCTAAGVTDILNLTRQHSRPSDVLPAYLRPEEEVLTELASQLLFRAAVVRHASPSAGTSQHIGEIRRSVATWASQTALARCRQRIRCPRQTANEDFVRSHRRSSDVKLARSNMATSTLLSHVASQT